jgi:predicted nucleic acid-binding protein
LSNVAVWNHGQGGSVAEVTGVRSPDAMHLAAAQRVGGSAVTFVTLDLRQAQAARTLGFNVVGA